MNIVDVRKRAYAMPLTSPAFPPEAYRFIHREYLIITYRTDKAALEAVVPEPLTIDEPLVKYEFIRMPDSTGFGDYTEGCLDRTGGAGLEAARARAHRRSARARDPIGDPRSRRPDARPRQGRKRLPHPRERSTGRVRLRSAAEPWPHTICRLGSIELTDQLGSHRGELRQRQVTTGRHELT